MRLFITHLLDLFSPQEKRRLLTIWLMMAGGALIEAAGIGAIPAFVAVLGEPDRVRANRFLSGVFDLLGIGGGKQLIVAACVGLALLFLLKNFYLLGLQFVQTSFTYRKMSRLGCGLFEVYLRKPVTFHFNHNTADLLHNIGSETATIITNLVMPLMNLATECMLVGCVAILLLVVDPMTSLVSLGVLGLAVFGFYRILRHSLARHGNEQRQHGKDMIKWVNQGLGAVKETKVLGRESFFIDAYSRHSQQFVKSLGFIQIANQAPRLFIETLAIFAMTALVIVMVNQPRSIQSILPTLTLFAVAAVRLMPSVSRIMSLVTFIRYHKRALDIVRPELLSAPSIVEARSATRLPFSDTLRIERLSYTYPGAGKPSLNEMSLEIKRGMSVGLIGESGAGKSTLVDVLIGLLEPYQGNIFVDSVEIRTAIRSWQRNIGYIPQSVYLTDDSVRRNVAFGIVDAEIDDARVRKALDFAQLEEFVDALPQGLDTEIGERGVRLSGGQRQRIGIARALYEDPEVLIMDEATAALDNNTEREITSAIENLSRKKTLIVIAHRLSTVRKCDILHYIDNGKIVASGSFDELLCSSPGFAKHAAL